MIRPATPADLAAVTEIYDHYVTTSTVTWRYELDDGWAARTLAEVTEAGRPFLVLDDADGVQGFAYLGIFRGRAGWSHTAEDTIYLRETAAGRGYGTALLQALLDAADTTDVHEVIGMISADAESSLALHAKLGFVESGRLPGVGNKFGQTLDCVLMQRSLIR
ncbi:MAG: GNAT family N-acetyltransferase [Gordonia sp. (in: high G+C Gram-positive bacteria)]|uniref:GNAT family N-acetyltransferase n=1 Tax=Gordonia sp. (in: high G+C Gram-positive bacteria) TaxID=84139 RepID=UPI0039E41CAF